MRLSRPVLAFSLVAAALSSGACSSDDEEAGNPVLKGTYTTDAAGEFKGFQFEEGRYYLQRNEPCGVPTTAACVERGTFSVTRDTLMLTDETTEAVKTLPFKELRPTSSGGLMKASLRPAANGGGALISGEPKRIVGESEQLITEAQELLKAFELGEGDGGAMQSFQTAQVKIDKGPRPTFSACRMAGGFCQIMCGGKGRIPSGDSDCREQYGTHQCCG